MPIFRIVTRQPVKLFLFHEVEAENDNEAREQAKRRAYELLRELDVAGVQFDDSYESWSEDVKCIFKPSKTCLNQPITGRSNGKDE
jgi:uncharacterized membrane protein